jgi:hypothetical protein
VIVAALVASAVAAPPVEVRVDRRVMAVTITAWLAREGDESADPMASLPAYRAALRAHFGPHRDHRAVQLAGQLARAGFTFDAPVGWALHLDERSFAPRVDIPRYYGDRAGSDERLVAYREALADFVRVARLDDFLDAMAPLHEAEQARVERLIDLEAIEALEAFYGQRPGARYTLLVVPTLGPHHYGPTVQGPDGPEHYQLSNTLRHTSDAGLRLALDDLLLHEFGHPLAKATLEAAGDRLERLGPALLGPIQRAMREQAYPTWSLTAEEHLVRAVTCRLLRQRHGEAAGQGCLAREVHRGFWYTVPLYEALGDYEAHRDRYPSLVHFERPLVRRLEAIAKQGARSWWSSGEWKLQRPLNGVVVLPTGPQASPELQAGARALAKRRYGGRLITDSEALMAPHHPYVVVGGPRANRLASATAARWPLSVDDEGLEVGPYRFVGPSLGLAARVSVGDVGWTVHVGTDEAGQLASLQLDAHSRGWAVAAAGGPLCADGHLPPGAERSEVPRVLGCEGPASTRPWVPEGLGEPVRWTAKVPIELAPDRFEASLHEALASCAPGLRVVGVACDEPPCVAVLASADEGPPTTDALEKLVGCAPWRVPLGPTVQHVRAEVTCPDGPQALTLVAPTPAPLRRSVGEVALADRLGYRWARWLSEPVCETRPAPSAAPAPMADIVR